jgi:type III secretion system YscQ/HrcQ family protein
MAAVLQEAPPAPGSLRLAQLDPRRLALDNQWLGLTATSTLALPQRRVQWRWRPAAPRACEELTLVLAAGAARCTLTIERDAGPALDDGIDLALYEGPARLLAAALRYAAVLSHVERITGQRLECIAVLDAAQPAHAGDYRIGFEASDASEPHAVLRGTLQCPMSLALSWPTPQGAPPALPDAAATLPVLFQISLARRLAVDAASLRRLRIGGALLLGAAPRDGLDCVLRCQGQRATALAQWQGDRLRLRGRLSPDALPDTPSNRSASMNTTSTPNAADVTASDALDAMPITLEFHLGRVSVPLSDLPAALSPGYVIELGRTLDEHAVTVRASGRMLARGELIQVGEQLAVRISSIAPSALDPDDDGSV